MTKRKKIIIIGSALVLLILSSLATYRYYFKTQNFIELSAKNGQEIFILGTIHNQHFNKLWDYSMQDIISCIENVQPDVVFIESRELPYKEYGVIDGPIEMILVYSYCAENNIPVKMIDWWEFSDSHAPSTTTPERDDRIYDNITSQLANIDSDKRVMIVCGTAHVSEQTTRFLPDGFALMDIDNKNAYFKTNATTFTYPTIMKQTIENKINYIGSDLILTEIENNITNDSLKEKYKSAMLNVNESLQNTLDNYLPLNLLY